MGSPTQHPLERKALGRAVRRWLARGWRLRRVTVSQYNVRVALEDPETTRCWEFDQAGRMRERPSLDHLGPRPPREPLAPPWDCVFAPWYREDWSESDAPTYRFMRGSSDGAFVVMLSDERPFAIYFTCRCCRSFYRYQRRDRRWRLHPIVSYVAEHDPLGGRRTTDPARIRRTLVLN
jgi:hypothetical protein